MDIQTNWLDVAGKVLTMLAIIAGGVGAYLKFFKGRTYHNRLQLEVSGKLVREGEVTCVLVTMQIKNVGVSSVYLNHQGTRIDLYSYAPEFIRPMPHLAIWESLKTFAIFENCAWIESGEAAKDELLIRIEDKPQVAYKIDMTVNVPNVPFWSRAHVRRKDEERSEGISFRSRAIVSRENEHENFRKDTDHESNA